MVVQVLAVLRVVVERQVLVVQVVVVVLAEAQVLQVLVVLVVVVVLILLCLLSLMIGWIVLGSCLVLMLSLRGIVVFWFVVMV